MKKITLLMIMLLASAQVLSAQEEKTAPPTTRIDLPEDTTANAAVDQKAEPKKPDLELPEVLILGAERNIEVTGEKQNIVPESPSLVKPDAPSEFVSTWFRQQSEKPAVSRDVSHVDEYAWAKLELGNGITADGQAGYWRQLPNGTLSGSAWGMHDAGDYANNATSSGGLRAQSTFEFGDGLSADVSGGFRGEKFGLYQILDSSATRSASAGNFRGSLQYNLSGSGKAELMFGLDGMSMRSDTAGGQFNETSDRSLRVSGRYDNQFQAIPFAVSIATHREDLSTSGNGNSVTNVLNQIGLESRLTFSNAWASTIGLRYETFANDSVNSLQRFSPYGKLNYVPTNYIGFSLRVFTGFEYQSFYKRVTGNAYAAHDIIPLPDRLRFGSQFTMDLQLTESFGLHGELRYANYDRLYYWNQDPVGFFRLANLTDVEIITLRFSAEFHPVDWLQFTPSLETYTNNYKSAAFGDTDYVPYRPQLDVPIAGEFDLGNSYKVWVESRYVGSRQTGFAGATELDPYWDMTAEVQRQFSDEYTIFLRGENLVSQEYSHWQGFQANGIRIMIGAKATF